MSVGVGLSLMPSREYLALLGAAFREDVDYLEVTPETTWIDTERGLEANGFSRAFLELADEAGVPFVGHGVGLSLGSASASAERTRRWLQRIAEDARVFQYRWYTDHLGMSVVAGKELALPLPLPMCSEVAADVRATLARLSALVGDVGVENVAHHFVLGGPGRPSVAGGSALRSDPLCEPAFLAACTAGDRQHLLLDLHNVFTMACNLDFDPRVYIDALPLERVIELHLSGGGESDPGWLPDGATVRLDGHDDRVPEEVWRLFEETLPRCENLRGVTLERMEGTVAQGDVPHIREELQRIRFLLERGGRR